MECAFSRDVLVPNLFAIRAGAPMVFNAGFNIYPSGLLPREAWGHNDGMEVLIPSPPKKEENENKEELVKPTPELECVCLARSLRLLPAASALMILLLNF